MDIIFRGQDYTGKSSTGKQTQKESGLGFPVLYSFWEQLRFESRPDKCADECEADFSAGRKKETDGLVSG